MSYIRVPISPVSDLQLARVCPDAELAGLLVDLERQLIFPTSACLHPRQSRSLTWRSTVPSAKKLGFLASTKVKSK